MNQTDLIINEIGTLKSIWERDNRTELEQFANKPRDIQEANEYAFRLIQLWDHLDHLSLEQVETLSMELDGLALSPEAEPINKILRTQVNQYLVVRVEQDGS